MLRLSLPELGPLIRLWKHTRSAHSASLTHAAPNGLVSAASDGSADVWSSEAVAGERAVDDDADRDDGGFPREHPPRASTR